MTATPRWNPSIVPLIGQLRSYDRAWLRGDLIAGIAVAALIVPKNLGYAGIAGIPLQNGLYAAAAGAIVYAIFGSCRQISVGPSSGLAAVAASAVLAAGLLAEQDIATFVAGITLASGLLYLLLALSSRWAGSRGSSPAPSSPASSSGQPSTSSSASCPSSPAPR